VNRNEIGEMKQVKAALPMMVAGHINFPSRRSYTAASYRHCGLFKFFASSDQITAQTLTAVSSRPSNPIQTSAFKAPDYPPAGFSLW
jgi:hypothetical protein